jgi:hypothetical protein
MIVSPGADLSGYEIRLRRLPIFRVHGVVLNETGKLAPGVAIRMEPSDRWQPQDAQAVSGKDGEFEFPLVRAGEWRLIASAVPGDYRAPEGIAAVVVEKHDVERVEIRMALPFTFTRFIDREQPRDAEGRRRASGVDLTPVGRARQIGVGLQDVMFVRNLRASAVSVHVEAGRTADASLKVTAWPE